MSLRERMYELTEVEHVDEFLERHPTSVFFKAGGCHKTMQGFGYVEEALNSREDIYMGFVRVIEHRPVSNYIAEITDVIHQSPQLILIKDGEVVFDVDNWDITPAVLEEAFSHHLGRAKGTQKFEKQEADATLYIDLLSRFIQKEISDDEFQNKWLRAFQQDATPRSTRQFELLNSLFGDVDAAIASGPVAKVSKSPLEKRAEKLYHELTH